MKKHVSILFTGTLILSACGAEKTIDTQVSSATTGITAVTAVASKSGLSKLAIRPAAALGVFTSSYLAQGVFIHVASAMNGIIAQQKLLEGQQKPTTSETFTLLTELATIMQVDIPDMLNRSIDRTNALNVYLSSLEATGNVAEQKYNELELQLEQLQIRRRTERDEAKAIEREINTAFRNEDYSTAASKQEAYATAEATLAQTDVEVDQTKDLIGRFEDMLEIADERLEVIVRNREVLIAGLRVTDMPGIESLQLLDESGKNRRNSNRDDIFGTQYIQE